jgi:hypothetical protein
MTDEEKAAAVASVPLGRIGTLDDLGKAAGSLASDDSAYVSGVELFVDGARFRSEYKQQKALTSDPADTAESDAEAGEEFLGRGNGWRHPPRPTQPHAFRNLQRHHPHPEHGLLADIDIVFARER